MDRIIRIIIFFILIIIFLIISIFIFYSIRKRYKKNRMYYDVKVIFDKLIKQNVNITYERKNNQEYDFILTTTKYLYYVKLIPNFYNEDICINSELKWTFGKSLSNEKKKDIKINEGLVRLDLIKEKNGKKPRKLFIVYPDAKTLLMVVNECEYEFVNNDSDVYGSKIITYTNLKNDPLSSIDF